MHNDDHCASSVLSSTRPRTVSALWETSLTPKFCALHCALAAAQCIVICPVCLCVDGWVCLWVCYHDNSKLSASIVTKLGLQVKLVTASSLLNFGSPSRRIFLKLNRHILHWTQCTVNWSVICFLVCRTAEAMLRRLSFWLLLTDLLRLVISHTTLTYKNVKTKTKMPPKI